VESLTLKELIHLFTNFEEDVHCWGVVILPLVLKNFPLEFAIIVLPATEIKYQVGILVTLL
jgi:hypothetical protein